MAFVKPEVWIVGYTAMDEKSLLDYLVYTDQMDFVKDIEDAKTQGLSGGEILCSFYAKLCYKSLTIDKNSNLSKVRSVKDNLLGTLNTAHGSVFEHCNINFVATDVSRVLTHEMVRHRAGWAYSQTSGRYCRLDQLDLVLDPILADCKEELKVALTAIEKCVYLIECRKGLRKPNPKYTWAQPEDCFEPTLAGGFPDPEMKWVNNDELKDFDYKKKVTSAARRIAPNGQSNEIGFTINIRAIRHFLMIRSARHAEWEIRVVAEKIYKLVKEKFPLLVFDAKEEVVNGALEITGMKTQPYER